MGVSTKEFIQLMVSLIVVQTIGFIGIIIGNIKGYVFMIVGYTILLCYLIIKLYKIPDEQKEEIKDENKIS